jgi:hypothetical protein
VEGAQRVSSLPNIPFRYVLCRVFFARLGEETRDKKIKSVRRGNHAGLEPRQHTLEQRGEGGFGRLAGRQHFFVVRWRAIRQRQVGHQRDA